MLVEHLLERGAREHPDRVALASGPRRLTYSELDVAADRLAAAFQSLGVRRGDRVVIHLENSIEAVLSLFGALKAGGVFVLVNPGVKADKLGYILADSGATVLVTDRRSQQVAADARRAASTLKTIVFVGGDGPFTEAAGVSCAAFDLLIDPSYTTHERTADGVIDLDLAALFYTSGSTGRPKGVMLTHANIVAASTSIGTYLGNSADDVILNVLPLSFDYGAYQVFLALRAGARLVVERSFVYPSVLLDAIVRERVTGLPIVPMIAALLLKHDVSAYDLSSLRYITNTGAVLPPAHIAALRERVPHVRIFSMYGLTECKRVSYLPPEEIDERPTSVGKPMPNVEVFLSDGDGRIVSSGLGELVVRGSNVMRGYWNSPEDTARVLRPGTLPGELWLYTGDIFRVDEQGYMYFQSRTDDVIKSRGQKVSPREIENVLHASPLVREAAVVGVADPVVGEAVKAYVTLTHPGAATEQELLWHCAQHLEDFMVPRTIEIVDALPHTTTGKISRNDLRQSA